MLENETTPASTDSQLVGTDWPSLRICQADWAETEVWLRWGDTGRSSRTGWTRGPPSWWWAGGRGTLSEQGWPRDSQHLPGQWSGCGSRWDYQVTQTDSSLNSTEPYWKPLSDPRKCQVASPGLAVAAWLVVTTPANNWLLSLLSPLTTTTLISTHLNEVVREHPGVAGQFSPPPASLHPLHSGDDVSNPQTELVRQLGGVLVEHHHLLNRLHDEQRFITIWLSHVYIILGC